MNGFSILYAALTVLNVWRFTKSRDRWHLALCLLFGLMLVRRLIPAQAFTLLLIGLLAWLVWLGVSKIIFALRLRRLLAKPSLPPLTDEEREWRSTLEDWERDYIESRECTAKSRLTRPAAMESLESARKSRREREAYLAEMAAEEERERAAEAEKKELEVSAVTSPLMLISSSGLERLWMKLERVDDGEEDPSGMVRCTPWAHQPSPDEQGASSFIKMSDVIGFPPEHPESKPVFWKSTTPEFKAMFEDRCLVADVEEMDDGRDRFDFLIEDRVFVIMTKYLTWRADLALDADSQRIWVRISEMLSEQWEETADGQGKTQPKFLDFERIPAFVYPVPVDRLMPSTNPDAHFASIEDYWQQQ